MNESAGYAPKDLLFDEEGRKKLMRGVEKIAKAVESTLGPRGNTVLIESASHTRGITVTKDGVTVAKSIALMDGVEDLAVRIVREAAEKTSTQAGDGTTTAIVLAKALIQGGMIYLKDENVNRTMVLRHLADLTEEVIRRLKANSRPVTRSNIRDVATISCNNDEKIGAIIAKAYRKVGKNGIVTVEKSQTTETYTEVTKGMRLQRGYTSPLFINDQRKDECVFEDTHILVCDTEISNILQIENVLKPVINQGKRLLIIAPCTNQVVNTLAANVARNNLKFCNINPPQFGYKQHEIMQDIAIAVGAKYFSEKTGDDLSLIRFEDLGKAQKVIVGRHQTIILTTRTDDTLKVRQRVDQLRAAHKEATKKEEKDFISERIAALTGGVGVVYVGGNTDLEQKELYDRVDDAVCAVKSALEEGIVAGSGKALYEIEFDFPSEATTEDKDLPLKEEVIAARILSESIKAPLRQILANAGMSEKYYRLYDPQNETKLADAYGYDLKNDRWGDLIEMGVIDPLKVTRCALQNAVAVATTILSTNAIVTLARVTTEEAK